MKSVAPGDQESVLNPTATRIVTVLRCFNAVRKLPLNRFVPDSPLDTVVAEARMQSHFAAFVVASENSSKAFAEGDGCTVENAIRCRNCVSSDDRVFGEPPDRFTGSFWLLLPRNVWLWWTNDFCAHKTECVQTIIQRCDILAQR